MTISFANKRTTLGCGYNKSQSYGRFGYPGSCHQTVKILLKLGTDQGEGFEDVVVGTGDGDNPLRAGPVSDVYLGPTLKKF